MAQTERQRYEKNRILSKVLRNMSLSTQRDYCYLESPWLFVPDS